MTEAEIEEALNLYGWGRWAMVNYDRMLGSHSILGQIALTGYREETKYPIPPISTEEAMSVDAVIATLPRETRQLLLLRYGKQMEYRAIGRAVRAHHATVKNRISSALYDIWQILTTTC